MLLAGATECELRASGARRTISPPFEKEAPLLSFPPFQLDVADERLWKDGKELHLRRKQFAILKHLVKNPRRLITHDGIVEAVWGKLVVSESLVRTHVRHLRQAIGEDLIETVVGRGYRFLADVTEANVDVTGRSANEGTAVVEALVARGPELDALDTAFATVRDGKRALVFITGEPGIGKTTLADAFVEKARAKSSVFVARAACVEQYGSGEAFLPILEALGSLCRSRGGEHVVDVLMRHAPTSLAQMPSFTFTDAVIAGEDGKQLTFVPFAEVLPKRLRS